MSARSRTLLLTALGAAVMATSGASTAAAATPTSGTFKLTPTSNLVGGPAIVNGGGLVWLEATRSSWRLRVLDAGATKPRTLVREDLSHVDDYESGDMLDQYVAPSLSAAGDTALVMTSELGGSTKTGSFESFAQVRAFSISTGAATKVTSCNHSRDDDARGVGETPAVGASFATDGATDVVSMCDRTTATPVGATAETSAVKLVGATTRVAVAGPYVATATPERITVRARTTGAPVYEIAIQANVPLYDFDLGADGAVAVVSSPSLASGGGPAFLTWHTPATPEGVALPVRPDSADVSVDGDKALVNTAALSGLGGILTEIGPTSPARNLAFLGWGPSPDFTSVGGVTAFGRGGCGGDGGVGIAYGDLTPVPTECPDLSVDGARRSGRTLSLRLGFALGLTKRLRLIYRAGGRTFGRTIEPDGDAMSLKRKIRLPAWAIGQRGTVEVTYPGDDLFVRQFVERTTVR